jgi:hypothetical protein
MSHIKKVFQGKPKKKKRASKIGLQISFGTVENAEKRFGLCSEELLVSLTLFTKINTIRSGAAAGTSSTMSAKLMS